MVDFRQLVTGESTVEHRGLTLTVAEIHYIRKGWVMIMATLDGEPVHAYRHCVCEHDQGDVLALDLVTEAEYLCCASCRALAPD